MPINKREVYEALEKFESKINPLTFLLAMKEGKSAAELTKEVKKELETALYKVPRFKDLELNSELIYLKSVEEQLEYIRNIASDIFSFHKKKAPADEILAELFIPGICYNDEIWISADSHDYVDFNAILLPPTLIGSKCSVARNAILGPYSCIENSDVEERAYVIKTIIGKFE